MTHIQYEGAFLKGQKTWHIAIHDGGGNLTPLCRIEDGMERFVAMRKMPPNGRLCGHCQATLNRRDGALLNIMRARYGLAVRSNSQFIFKGSNKQT